MEKGGQQVEGGDSLPLPPPHEIPPVVPLPSLEYSTSPQHGTVGLDPEEGHKNSQSGTPPLRRQPGTLVFVQPGEGKDPGGC